MRAIDASTSSTGEISFVPIRRRISTDDSASNSSDGIISNPRAVASVQPVMRGRDPRIRRLRKKNLLQEMDGLPGQARQ